MKVCKYFASIEGCWVAADMLQPSQAGCFPGGFLYLASDQKGCQLHWCSVVLNRFFRFKTKDLMSARICAMGTHSQQPSLDMFMLGSPGSPVPGEVWLGQVQGWVTPDKPRSRNRPLSRLCPSPLQLPSAVLWRDSRIKAVFSQSHRNRLLSHNSGRGSF